MSVAARIVFAAGSLLWFGTTTVAFVRIRRGRVLAHREWMIRSFSLAFFFVTGSLWMPILAGTALPAAIGYPLAVFLSWSLNLVAAELWVRRTRSQPSRMAIVTGPRTLPCHEPPRPPSPWCSSRTASRASAASATRRETAGGRRSTSACLLAARSAAHPSDDRNLKSYTLRRRRRSEAGGHRTADAATAARSGLATETYRGDSGHMAAAPKHMVENRCDVLVVGAGPTGFTLATALAALGVNCRIVDKGTDRALESRALAVQPRSLEVLRSFDLADELVRRGNPAMRLRLRTGSHVSHTQLFDLGLEDTAFPLPAVPVPGTDRGDLVRASHWPRRAGRAPDRAAGFRRDGGGAHLPAQEP